MGDTALFYHESGHCDLSSLPVLEGPHAPDTGITFKKLYAADVKSHVSESNQTEYIERVVFVQSGMVRFPGRDSKVIGYLTYEEAVAAFLADHECTFMDMARPLPNNKYDTHFHWDATGKSSLDNPPKLESPHDPSTGTTFTKVRINEDIRNV